MTFKEVTITVRFKEPRLQSQNNRFLSDVYDDVSAAAARAGRLHDVSVFGVERSRSRVVR